MSYREVTELDRVESRTTVRGGCAYILSAVQAPTRTIGRNPTPMIIQSVTWLGPTRF
ncbi:hypothetical protein FIBSPDRAFT_847107 [Athelia psychrophila]|uniref:Uncharacterized protein n=1 Tax=Athelia psychrophila TaxID=1759441 RepID=A0A166WPS2_9AGAM|nr:hypothetical protein FIBSPDRAFT_847107 [Fibularhizoctonia sp. CBS 109695]